MSRFYKYSVLKFQSDSVRNESLNIGIVVFNDDAIDVRLTQRLNKLHSISAAIDVDKVRNLYLRLNEFDLIARNEGLNDVETRLSRISEIVSVKFSPIGSFDAHNHDGYEAAIQSIIKKLVDPEPSPPKLPKKRPTKLKSSLLKLLKAERILAKQGEGLSSHRVVANYPIVDGIEADLMLKNGAMHVFEAVDVSQESVSARKIISDIGFSSIVFEQARMTFGEQTTQTKLIYQASAEAESLAFPALSVAEHQGATLINWESSQDREKFLSQLEALAEPFEDAKSKEKRPTIHASAQSKFLIN